MERYQRVWCAAMSGNEAALARAREELGANPNARFATVSRIGAVELWFVAPGGAPGASRAEIRERMRGVVFVNRRASCAECGRCASYSVSDHAGGCRALCVVCTDEFTSAPGRATSVRPLQLD